MTGFPRWAPRSGVGRGGGPGAGRAGGRVGGGAGVSAGHHGRLRRAAQDTFGASVGAPQYLEIKGEVAMGVTPAAAWSRRGPAGAHRRHVAGRRRRSGDDRVHRRTSGPDPGGAPGRGPGRKRPAARGRCAGRGVLFRPALGCAPRKSASWLPWEFFVWWFTKSPVWPLSLPGMKSSPSIKTPARPGAGCQRLSGRGPGAGVGRPASAPGHSAR